MGKENKRPKNDSTGSVPESKMSALCLLLEFGLSEEMAKAREELIAIAYECLGDSDSNNIIYPLETFSWTHKGTANPSPPKHILLHNEHCPSYVKEE
jgi:hypothetical protein